MTIYSLDDLRRTAPAKMRDMSDVAILCKYSDQKGRDVNEVAIRLGRADLTPINCRKTLAIEFAKNYQLPFEGLSVGVFVALSFFIILSISKYLFRKFNSQKLSSTLIRWLVGSFAFGLALGVVSMIDRPIYTSFLIVLAWGTMIFLLGAAFSIVVHVAKSKRFKSDAKIAAYKVQTIMLGRKDKTLWSQIAREVEDEKIDPGMWLQALSKAEGDEVLAKSVYIRLRYDELMLSTLRVD